MTSYQPEQVNELRSLLADFIAASVTDRQASNERMTQLEEMRERDRITGGELLIRL